MIWQKIKEERFVLLWLALLGMLRAMHEIAKFRADWSWLPQWDYPFGIMTPPLDSYHVYGGLFAITIIAGFRLQLRDAYRYGVLIVTPFWVALIIIAVEYLIFFWVFTLFYHGLFMKAEFMQWDYIIPLYKLFGG